MPDKDFSELWARDGKRIVRDSASMEQVAEYFFMQGRNHERPSLSAQEAQRVEAATVGESINYTHLGDVLEAKRQIG